MSAAPTRVDWFRVLDDLKRADFDLRDVAYFTGIPRSTLFGYRAGSEPGYTAGEKLLKFWAQSTGRASEEAPRVDPYSYRA